VKLKDKRDFFIGKWSNFSVHFCVVDFVESIDYPKENETPAPWLSRHVGQFWDFNDYLPIYLPFINLGTEVTNFSLFLG